MLKPTYASLLSAQDQQVFDALVPADHYLRQVLTVVDFERFRPLMTPCYHATDGRPANDPVVLLKRCYLQTHYGLSNRAVIAHAQVNIAFRYVLALALTDTLPHPTLLTVFRERLGTALYEQIFDALVAQARTAGLVKDRLRLKDATHIIATIAIPSTIRLVAQTRPRLLDAAEPCAAEVVVAERAHALVIRTAPADLSDEERLLPRVAHLRQIVGGADQVSANLGPLPEPVPTDRRAGDEATDASALLRHEETVHGNDVHILSIDKAGFRGELLREWHDPQALNLEVVVPPIREKPTPSVTAVDFVHDPQQGTMTCPSGKTTTRRIRHWVDTGWKYSFRRSACATCALYAQCLARLPKATGRQVVINDYAAEYAAARDYARSERYRQIRREHPAIERKLADVGRRHAGRWVRCGEP
jgi:transposase